MIFLRRIKTTYKEVSSHVLDHNFKNIYLFDLRTWNISSLRVSCLYNAFYTGKVARIILANMNEIVTLILSALNYIFFDGGVMITIAITVTIMMQ